MKIDLEKGKYIDITIWKNEKGAYEYYNDDVLIGIFDPNVMKDSKFFEVDIEKSNVLPKKLTEEDKEINRKIIDEVKEKINELKLDELEEEAGDNQAIARYFEENGISRDKIKTVKKFDLQREQEKTNGQHEKDEEHEKEADGQRENNTKQKKDEDSKTEQLEEESRKDKEKTKETFVTTSDVNIKQEIELNERATDVENFRKWLGGKIPQDVTKIAVINASEMSKMKDENGQTIDTPSTQFGLVAISKGKNGQGKRVEPLKKYIPQLEQNHRSGNNPVKNQYQLSTDGRVEKDAVLSEYSIGNKIIQLDKDYGDNFEVNIGKYAPSSNEIVTTRMRDKNTTFATDIETRKAVMGHYKGNYATENSYKEAKEHEEAGCKLEMLTEKEIDGKDDTGHTHFTQAEVETYVKEIMQNEDISDIFTEREVKERLEKNLANKTKAQKEKSIKDIKAETELELEQDASHYKTMQRR